MSPWYSKKCEIGESILASHLKMQIKKKTYLCYLLVQFFYILIFIFRL